MNLSTRMKLLENEGIDFIALCWDRLIKDIENSIRDGHSRKFYQTDFHEFSFIKIYHDELVDRLIVLLRDEGFKVEKVGSGDHYYNIWWDYEVQDNIGCYGRP